MSTEVGSIHPDATLQRAAEMMGEMNVEMLTVCDRGRLVGVITDRDLAVRAAARGLSPHACLVGDIMSSRVVWCSEDQEIDEVLQQMDTRRLSRFPVLGRGRAVVGLVCRQELVSQRAPGRQADRPNATDRGTADREQLHREPAGRDSSSNGQANACDALSRLFGTRDEAAPHWLRSHEIEAGSP